MMRPMRLLTLVLLYAAGALLSRAATPVGMAAAASGVDNDVHAALRKLYAVRPWRRGSGGRPGPAVLVFPNIVKAGFMIGGQHGTGALVKNGKIVGHYRSVAASYGLQAGVQTFGYALFLMNDRAPAGRLSAHRCPPATRSTGCRPRWPAGPSEGWYNDARQNGLSLSARWNSRVFGLHPR